MLSIGLGGEYLEIVRRLNECIAKNAYFVVRVCIHHSPPQRTNFPHNPQVPHVQITENQLHQHRLVQHKSACLRRSVPCEKGQHYEGENGKRSCGCNNMASESEAWWTQHYTVYSIRDLQALPIFSKFLAMHYPFVRGASDRTESFSSEGTIDTYQWSAHSSNEGEKFSHDRSSDTWCYEHRFQDKECHTTVTSWLSDEAEWGEIVRKYVEYEIWENWRLQASTRHYERYSLQGGEKRGLKTARLPSQDGLETWTETYWEKEGESEFEKVWERPGASGGENKHNRGDYWWGEVWHRNGGHMEKKVWHTKGDRDWGHVHGEACGKVWDEKWDISKAKRDEEKLTQDGDRHRGFRYLRNGKDWYKQEWDGLAVLGVDEGLERVKKGEVRQDLDEVSANSHDTLLKGEHTIELLLRSVPHFKAEVDTLKQERVDIHKPDSQSVDELLVAIRAERELADKQERLKQRMIDDVYADHGKYYELHLLLAKLLEESHGTLKHIAEVAGKNEDTEKDLQNWENRLQTLRADRTPSSFGRDLQYLEALQDLEKSKLLDVSKLKGGVPNETTEDCMNLLYTIMLRHDAVSDRIMELVPDEEIKTQLDGFEERFEKVHQQFQETSDPKLVPETLKVLLDYQPIHLHQLSKLSGLNKDQIADQENAINSVLEKSKGKPSLKSGRVKVRSGRPTAANPFQIADGVLERLIPFMLRTNEVVRAKEDLSILKAAGEDKSDAGTPEGLFRKLALLGLAADGVEPKLETHESKLRDLDTQLDTQITTTLEYMEDEDRTQTEELLARHYADEDVDLLSEKLTQATGVQIETETTSETEVQNLKETLERVQTIIREHEDQIASLRRQLEDTKKRLGISEEEAADLRKYKPLFEDRDIQCKDFEARNKKLEMDNSDQKLAIDANNAEITRLGELVNSLEKFKETALDNEKEISHLKGVISNYEEILGDRKAQFGDVVNSLNDRISALDSRIKELEAEIARLKKQLEAKEMDRRKQLMLRVVSALSTTLKTEKFSTFLGWKAKSDEPLEILSDSVLREFPEVTSTVIEDEQEFTSEEATKLTEAEQPILTTRRNQLSNNIIFKHMRTGFLSFEPAQPVADWLALAEELLEKKMEADTADLGQKKVPADFASFTIEYLLHTKGVKKLAQEALQVFIPTLYRLNRDNSPFAVALSQLLHMFSSSPASIEGAILAVRYSQLFRPLFGKYVKGREERHVSAETPGNLAFTGGEALLIDVLNEFYEPLMKDDVSLWHFLRQIKPLKVPVGDYVLSVVHWFAHAKKHMNHHEVWEAIAHGKPAVTQDEFVNEMISWGLHLSPRILKEAFAALAPGGQLTEEITVNRGEILRKMEPEDFLVTRGSFMLGVLQAMKARIRRNALKLRNQFQVNGSDSLDDSAFTQLAMVWDPALPEEVRPKLHAVGVAESESTPVDVGGFERTLCSYPAGDLSKLPLHVPELLYLFDPHTCEYDLETGVIKVTTSKTTKTITTKTSRIVKAKKG